MKLKVSKAIGETLYKEGPVLIVTTLFAILFNVQIEA